VKAPLAGHKSDCHFIWEPIDKEHGATSLQRSQWVLMTKDVIPGSRDKLYADQKAMVAGKAQYEVPDLLLASVGILTHHVRTGERLFSNEPTTYTCCKEVVGGYQTAVGGFAPAGLSLDYDSFVTVDVGVAAQWKF
jgi:hypothetical protein